MLQTTKMVKVRKAVESLYDGVCTITEYQKIKKENKSTAFSEVVVLENQPCRMSHKTVNSTTPTDTANAVTQSIVVYLSPDIVVKPGSKLTITQNNVTNDYKCSGKPAVYSSHQEIPLELFEGWA
ncbi:MAG: hypothetical protein IJZ16_01255 [Clostridia bacterium]|nr:hypothetical protein [Clostridia bacterium]